VAQEALVEEVVQLKDRNSKNRRARKTAALMNVLHNAVAAMEAIEAAEGTRSTGAGEAYVLLKDAIARYELVTGRKL
jgi:hypothetical protein